MEYSIERQEKSMIIAITCIEPAIIKSLNNHLITVLESYHCLKDLTTEFIIDICCEYFGMTIEEIFNSCRKRETVYKRHIIIYFIHGFSKENMSSIHRRYSYLKGIDHATQIYAWKSIRKLLSQDAIIATQVNAINEILKQKYNESCRN